MRKEVFRSLKLFTINISDRYFFMQLGKKVDTNFSVLFVFGTKLEKG
jgi:hypothetical protein